MERGDTEVEDTSRPGRGPLEVAAVPLTGTDEARAGVLWAEGKKNKPKGTVRHRRGRRAEGPVGPHNHRGRGHCRVVTSPKAR